MFEYQRIIKTKKTKHWLDKKHEKHVPKTCADVPFSDGEKANHPSLHKHHWGMTSSLSGPSFWCTSKGFSRAKNLHEPVESPSCEAVPFGIKLDMLKTTSAPGRIKGHWLVVDLLLTNMS
jgi:hypothetical protein